MPFISNPARDASDSIAGYVYQIDVTLSRWLNLQSDELLELERGEDLDIVQVSEDHVEDLRTLEQIKTNVKPLTLRSANALTALANFCNHRQTNPGRRLVFRYVTTSRIGKEKTSTLARPAIELWEAIRRGELEEDEEATSVLAIRELLRDCHKPSGLNASTWKALLDILSDGSEGEFQGLIQSLEWGTSGGDANSLEEGIKRALVESKYATDRESSQRQLERLFFYVVKRLTEQGRKTLTPQELRQQLEQPSLIDNDLVFVTMIRTRALEERLAAAEAEIARSSSLLNTVSEQMQTLVGTYKVILEYQSPSVSLDAPVLTTPSIPRSHVIDEIRREMITGRWVNIVGEPGSGKTQLCLLLTGMPSAVKVWISFRGLNQERSCTVLDAALKISSGVNSHPIIRQWYLQAVTALPAGTTIVLDDLPSIIAGSPLDFRLQVLQAACKGNGLRMLSTSYYELPRAPIESGVAGEIRAPRFTADEILELLQLQDAPSRVANSKFAEFLTLSTGGLPVVVAAVIRFLISKNWISDASDIEALLKAEYAASLKKDARHLIEGTVTDSDARELLYGLTCVVGPISRQQVETIGKIAGRTRLTMEKFNGLIGLWVQPYKGNTYLLSPLVDSSLAELLNLDTRRKIHSTLGALILKKKLSTVDVITCVHHFRLAEHDNMAVIVLIQALLKILSFPTEVPNEWMIRSLWGYETLPESIDITLRLTLRALQIALADKREKDRSFLHDDFNLLVYKAQDDDRAQTGLLMASVLLATQFIRKSPIEANRYILMALQSSGRATMPDGTKLALPKKMAMEWLLWGTAGATSTDVEIDSWLETVAKLSPQQASSLSESDLANDNSVVFCDSVWLREYRKPEDRRDWRHAQLRLQLIERKAGELGLDLLNAAAIRGQIVILAEALNQLPRATDLANEALNSEVSDGARFLIEEVTGRQYAYAKRWEEALRWMSCALDRNVSEWVILRRNLLITIGEGIASYEPDAAAEYPRQAVELAKSETLAPARIAEALGEYAIALWDAGLREKAFIQWEEAVSIITASENLTTLDTQTLLALIHAAGYFSSMVSHECPPNSQYAIPHIGFFLAIDHIPVELYTPIKKKLLLAQTGTFAEGVGDTEAAGKWINRALGYRPSEPGGDLLRPFISLAIAPAVLAGQYKLVIARARLMSARVSDTVDESLEALELTPETRTRMRRVLSDQKRIEVALLFGFVPAAFRLATVQFDRDVSAEIEEIEGTVDALDGEGTTAWKEALALMKSILSDEVPWRELHSRVAPYYAEHHTALGILCFLGSIRTAPDQQSLASQIALARDLEKLFQTNFSIRYKILLPFFEKYWDNAISSGAGAFRTAAAYTRRSFDAAAVTPIPGRLKEVFKSMVFCLGVSLPSDLRNWLDA